PYADYTVIGLNSETPHAVVYVVSLLPDPDPCDCRKAKNTSAPVDRFAERLTRAGGERRVSWFENYPKRTNICGPHKGTVESYLANNDGWRSSGKFKVATRISCALSISCIGLLDAGVDNRHLMLADHPAAHPLFRPQHHRPPLLPPPSPTHSAPHRT